MGDKLVWMFEGMKVLVILLWIFLVVLIDG